MEDRQTHIEPGNHNQANVDEYGEIDVVVVGSGFAGLAAGLEALDTGASTLILEKRNNFGGNSVIADGSIAAAGTPQQAALNIDDCADLMSTDMLRVGLGYNDPIWRETANHLSTVHYLKILEKGEYCIYERRTKTSQRRPLGQYQSGTDQSIRHMGHPV